MADIIKKQRNKEKYEGIDDIFGGMDIRKDSLKSPSKDVKINISEYNFGKAKKEKKSTDVRIERTPSSNEPKKQPIFSIGSKKAPAPKKTPSLSSPMKKPVAMPSNIVKRKPMKTTRIEKVHAVSERPRLKEMKKIVDTSQRSKDVKKPSVKAKAEIIESSESDDMEDYDSDDSLDVEDRMDYYNKNYSSFIKKAFGYDRHSDKYKQRDRQRMDMDLRSFEDRQREENRSYKLALKEDREERLRQEKRKKK